jgi:murein DD-endopeptidase MepM/ murein hydrolase activator NlpD
MLGVLQRCGRSRLSKIVLVASVGSLAAACSSNAVRFSDSPLFGASNGGAEPATQTAYGVEQRALSPISGATALAADNSLVTTPSSLRERGWTVEGAPIVEVSAGDTAASLSQGFGVPVSVILEANSLTSATDVRPGQRLVIPTYVYRDNPAAAAAVVATATPAPVAAPIAPAAGPGTPPSTLGAQAVAIDGGPAAASGRSYVVAAGDTLYSIARKHGVSPGELARVNGIGADGTVKLGTPLTIPAAGTSGGVAPHETQVASLEPQPTASGIMSDAAPEARPQTVEPPAAVVQPTDGVSSAGASGFRWPVRGRIIAGFGKQADGARNDGINLAVPAGTPVHAAEEGTVIYAGNELQGYGNLILIQHKDDWVSAYAHNESISVKRGDTVKRGQTIASVGKSGSVDQPQLHFELRKKSKPVDPLPHLSGA